MERRSRATLGFILIACMAFGIIPCTAIPFEGIAPSHPIQLTTDPHYDRNPSILLADDGTYWLFFTRGKTFPGIRSTGYNPDLDYYDIWYKRSQSLEGLKRASEWKIPLDPSENAWSAQRDVAALQTADGRIWAFSSPGYGPEGGTDRGILYYISDRAWTGPFIIRPGTYDGCGIGHLDVLEFKSRLWVTYDDCYTLKATSLDPASGWSEPVTIAERSTLGKPIAEDGSLYIAWVYIDPLLNLWGPGIYLSSSPDGNSWTSTQSPIAAWGNGLTNWDPVLIKDRKIFRLFWAPSDTEQFIATSSSRTPMDPASWSDPVRVTSASGNGNSWWDFWPKPIPKGRHGDGTLALLYTSEGNADGTGMTDGNIWMEIAIPRGIDR